MTDDSPVLFEVRGRIAVLTLNRPTKINAMNGEVYELLDQYVAEYAARPELRCMVITGAGGNYSSGGDLKWFFEMEAADPTWVYDFPAYKRLDLLEKPIISAIDGFCLASGFNLAVLYTDIRIASSRAVMGIPGPRRGLGVGAAYPMPLNRHMSIGDIMYMFLTGNQLTAQDCLRMGLISEVVEEGDVLDRAIELAELVAEGNPREVIGLKRFWRMYPDLPGSSWGALATMVRDYIDVSGNDSDEGKRAFLEKREPQWKD